MRMRFVEIPPYGDEFKRLQLFANSFNHVLDPLRSQKIVAFEKGEKTYGYADIVYLPIAFPAFHPDVTSPRGVVEVVEGWKAHCELNTGGEGYIGVPLDESRTTFPKQMLEKLGFQKLERELYSLK